MRRRRRRSARARMRAAGRAFLAFLFSNVGVVGLVIAYTIAGAFMFQAIEGSSEMERANNMERERDNIVQYLWQNVTLIYNPINETAKERISVALHRYQRTVALSIRRGWDGAGGRMRRQWSFSSAFLYSLTVITTIGYGHLSPRTSWGKVSTVFYALLGMPLFLLYLTNVGALLARWCKCLYALVCLCRGCPGFTRRRVARMQTHVEISDPESIERPEVWGDGYTFTDASSEHFPPIRYPSRSFQNYPDRRRNPPDPRHRAYRFEADPRHELDFRCPAQMVRYGTDPYMYNPRRLAYFRSASMPQPRPAYPAPPRGWSEPAHGTSDYSDFSYVTFDAQTITVPISVCVTIMVGYLIFGSMIFGMWEKWDQLDGAYFCFISLSSIGFGDFVPGERVYTPRIETSFIVCSLYLTLGMALVAMCFNLMQEQVISYVAGFRRAVKRICRCCKR